MKKPELLKLFSKYPETIALMGPSFNSHEFILHLARDNQLEYVEALYAYKDSLHAGKAAPFKALHGQLATHLNKYPTLIAQDAMERSADIFQQPSEAMRWRKV
jgi:hypothetical protein